MAGSRWQSAVALLQRETAALVKPQRSDRPWQLPFAAAISSGVPLGAGVWFGMMSEGALGAVAGLSFLYLPGTSLHHRIPVIMACAFAMTASYALGLAAHAMPGAAIPLIGLVALGGAMFCRAQGVIRPGPLFMVMTASIAAFTPIEPSRVIASLGYFAIGCMWACTVAVIYSAYILRRRPALPATTTDEVDYRAALIDSVITGLAVCLSLAVASVMGLDKAYWVPVSCLAVMQGVTLRASWSRSIHRIVGTVIGMGVTWLLAPLLDSGWAIVAAIALLTFLTETAVVRHYAFAAMFFTPLTIILAESSSPGSLGVTDLMLARLLDTVVGAVIGFASAILLHNRQVRNLAAQPTDRA